MKPTSEWNLNYILQLPPGEFDWVEFKGRKILDISQPGVDENKVLDELAKQLSAFANSGGGVIVYGITDPTDHKPRAVDDGGIAIAIKKPNTREWLEDVIPNLAEFPVRKFNVYALTNKSGAPGLANDRCLILVDIPDSEGVPHQSTRDKKYYARVGGKSRPIGHRLVADMFHRERHARFEVQMSLRAEMKTYSNMFPIGPKQTKQVREVTLSISAHNKGKRMAQYVRLLVWLPVCIIKEEQWDKEESDTTNDTSQRVREFNNTRRDVMSSDPTFGVTRRGPSWFDPILPGLFRDWETECRGSLTPAEMSPDAKLSWAVFCDNAPPVFGESFLKDIPFSEE